MPSNEGSADAVARRLYLGWLSPRGPDHTPECGSGLPSGRWICGDGVLIPRRRNMSSRSELYAPADVGVFTPADGKLERARKP